MIRSFNARQKQSALIIVSLVTSGSLLFLVYVHYLQSFGFSLKRALVGAFAYIILFCIVYFVARNLLRKCFANDGLLFTKSIGFWMLISLLFAPHILPTPHYPVSPLFQPMSEIVITFKFPEDAAQQVQLKGIWLSFDGKKYSSSDFVLSENWDESSGKFFIEPNEKGSLIWRGKIGERAKLTIFPMDVVAEVSVLWDGELRTELLKDNSVLFSKKSSTPFGYYVSITLASILAAGFILFVLFNWLALVDLPQRRTLYIVAFLVTTSLLLVYAHFQSPDITDKIKLQINYHETVLAGRAPSPWQYRLLSEWLLEGLIHLTSLFKAENPFYFAALILRIAQNILIYFLAFLYFRALGFSRETALVGILFLTGSMLNSFFKSGFSFNTYFDLIFYLGAGLLILNRSFSWLPMIMVAAALNRETSGLIPFLAFSSLVDVKDRRFGFLFISLSFFCWGGVFVILRILYPDAELFIPYERPPGIPLLLYNLFPLNLDLLFRFFGIIPLLGLLVIRQWKPVLARFFVVLIPIWFGVHLFASVITETRLFLVPQAMVFIPLFLLFVDRLKGFFIKQTR